MKCRLFVFRHSETFDNSRGVFSGWRDSALTPKGLHQAEAISKQLKPYQIDYAFTSHLKRAKQTLNIVLRNHNSIPKFIDDRLIERCYGLWQGKHKLEIENQDPDIYDQCHRGYSLAPPNGESLEMVEKRVLPFLSDLTEWLKHNPGNVAISCHNNSIRPFRKRFEKLSLSQMYKIASPQDNALIYSLDLDAKLLPKQKFHQSQAIWNGVRIPRVIRLATDNRNSLRTYYP